MYINPKYGESYNTKIKENKCPLKSMRKAWQWDKKKTEKYIKRKYRESDESKLKENERN